jgi:tetratricopeptide (TPR) repeat protein
MKIKTPAETLTMQFVNIKAESCELQITWAKTGVSIPVTTNIKDRLKIQIETALQTDKKPYWQAAQFYKEYENNLTKALDYCNKAIEVTDKPYWIWLYKAKIQKELGDKAGAKISAQKSLELAKDARNDDYVKMDEDLLRKLK